MRESAVTLGHRRHSRIDNACGPAGLERGLSGRSPHGVVYELFQPTTSERELSAAVRAMILEYRAAVPGVDLAQVLDVH